MINKPSFLLSEEYRINVLLLFLFSFIFFQPIFKYLEYVLNFPRINFSIIIFLLFSLYMIAASNLFLTKYNIDLLFSFWIILFISGIQIISIPWAIHYGLNGPEQFLKIISKTFFCYWMFWFCGLHIKKIINHKYVRLFFSISWIISVLLIFINSLTNEVFSIILQGKAIYLMLGDTFAVLSIFMLIYNKKFDLLILLISMIALFALWSRASLYSFIIISFIYMFKEHKIKLLLLLFLLIFSHDQLLIFKDDRMLRIIFGVFDTSVNARGELLKIGLNEMKMVWLFGDFTGDVKSNYGHSGKYIHSYLSFLRQFGIIPFISLFVLTLYCYIKIIISWYNNNSKHINFIFYFTTFIIIEILFARSYMHPYIWLSLSSIPLINERK